MRSLLIAGAAGMAICVLMIAGSFLSQRSEIDRLKNQITGHDIELNVLTAKVDSLMAMASRGDSLSEMSFLQKLRNNWAKLVVYQQRITAGERRYRYEHRFLTGTVRTDDQWKEVYDLAKEWQTYQAPSVANPKIRELDQQYREKVLNPFLSVFELFTSEGPEGLPSERLTELKLRMDQYANSSRDFKTNLLKYIEPRYPNSALILDFQRMAL